MESVEQRFDGEDLAIVRVTRWVVPAVPALERRFLLHSRAWHTPPASPHGPMAWDMLWARNGLYHGLKVMGARPNQIVLVPAYVCRSVPEAIIAAGAQVEFYRVDRQCQLDLEDIKGRLRSNVGAVVAIHYFGWPQPQMSDLRSLCDRYDIVLVEDCAHLLPLKEVVGCTGQHGHFSIYSWRKFLPVFDGATLCFHAATIKTCALELRGSLVMELRSAKDTVERWRGRHSFSRPMPRDTTLCVTNQCDTTSQVPSGSRTAQQQLDTNADGFLNKTIPLPMTRVSRWIRDHSDFTAIAQARRRNFGLLLEAITTIPRVEPLWRRIHADGTPWVFPCRIDRNVDTHVRLRLAGIQAATWGGVRPAMLPLNQFEEAEDLYRTLVFLPVHQSLDERAVGVMRLELAAAVSTD